MYRNIFKSFIIIALIFFFDQSIKSLVLQYSSIDHIYGSNIIGISMYLNSGIAFNILSEHTYIVVFIVEIILFLLLEQLFQHIYNDDSSKRFLALSFLIGGLMSNLSDHMFNGLYLHGYVVDYIKILSFPIFNFADLAILIGLLLYQLL